MTSSHVDINDHLVISCFCSSQASSAGQESADSTGETRESKREPEFWNGWTWNGMNLANMSMMTEHVIMYMNIDMNRYASSACCRFIGHCGLWSVHTVCMCFISDLGVICFARYICLLVANIPFSANAMSSSSFHVFQPQSISKLPGQSYCTGGWGAKWRNKHAGTDGNKTLDIQYFIPHDAYLRCMRSLPKHKDEFKLLLAKMCFLFRL